MNADPAEWLNLRVFFTLTLEKLCWISFISRTVPVVVTGTRFCHSPPFLPLIFPFGSPPFPLQLPVATGQARLNGLPPQGSIDEMSLVPFAVPIRTGRLLYHYFQSDYSPFSASCPICGKELLPNKVASHIRHETNSLKGNVSTDQQESDHRATVHFNLIY